MSIVTTSIDRQFNLHFHCFVYYFFSFFTLFGDKGIGRF